MQRSSLIIGLLFPVLGLLAGEAAQVKQLDFSNASDLSDGYKFSAQFEYFFQICEEANEIGILHQYSLQLLGYHFGGKTYAPEELHEKGIAMADPAAVAPVTLTADLLLSDKNLGRVRLWHLYPDMQLFGRCREQNQTYVLYQLDLTKEFQAFSQGTGDLRLENIEVASIHRDENLERDIREAWAPSAPAAASGGNPLAPLTIFTTHVSFPSGLEDLYGPTAAKDPDTAFFATMEDKNPATAGPENFFFVAGQGTDRQVLFSSIFFTPLNQRNKLPYRIDILQQFEDQQGELPSLLFGPFHSVEEARSRLHELAKAAGEAGLAIGMDIPFHYRSVNGRPAGITTQAAAANQLTETAVAPPDADESVSLNWMVSGEEITEKDVLEASTRAPAKHKAAIRKGGYPRYQVKTATSLRTGPDHSYQVVLRLYDNFKVELIEPVDTLWVKVSYKGKTGYAKRSCLGEM